MGTEKTIVRYAKGDGRIVNTSQSKPAMVRWTLTRHLMADYSSAKNMRVSGNVTNKIKVHEKTKKAAMT